MRNSVSEAFPLAIVRSSWSGDIVRKREVEATRQTLDQPTLTSVGWSISLAIQPWPFKAMGFMQGIVERQEALSQVHADHEYAHQQQRTTCCILACPGRLRINCCALE